MFSISLNKEEMGTCTRS